MELQIQIKDNMERQTQKDIGKIFLDEDFITSTKNVMTKHKIGKILLENDFLCAVEYLQFDKLDDYVSNKICSEINKEIIQDEDFKALMTKHEIENECQYLFVGALIGFEKKQMAADIFASNWKEAALRQYGATVAMRKGWKNL